ncbi:MAG: molybdopterin-dependent oxidoreductase, partial [Myxococcota bacterium]
MPTTHFATCPLCEASCGLRVEVEASRVSRVRGDPHDPLSRGYLCPKGVALADLHDDPELVRRPLRKRAGRWHEIGWNEAFDEAAQRLSDLQQQHGRDAVATYIGTPTLHSYGAMLTSQVFLEVLRSRNLYTSNSVDALPRLLTSYFLYGSQALHPLPDLDRARHLLILGANPVVSNGSIMTSPGCKKRLEAIRDRGGRIVVIDPRRSETAEVADAHHFIRPGSDALLLLALLHTLFTESLFSARRVQGFVLGIDRLRDLVRPFPPEAVSGATAIPARVIRTLARDFASAESAVCYGRMGVSTQSFGTLATWLIDCLNIVTGNLDRPGGAM